MMKLGTDLQYCLEVTNTCGSVAVRAVCGCGSCGSRLQFVRFAAAVRAVRGYGSCGSLLRFMRFLS